MKPHIRLEQRLWVCRTYEATGYGYDELMAWQEWWQMLRRKWITVAAADSAAQL